MQCSPSFRPDVRIRPTYPQIFTAGRRLGIKRHRWQSGTQERTEKSKICIEAATNSPEESALICAVTSNGTARPGFQICGSFLPDFASRPVLRRDERAVGVSIVFGDTRLGSRVRSI